MTSTLLFIGDSITDAGRRTDPLRPLGEGYVSVLAQRLAARGDDVRLLNTGISGNRAVDLQRRWNEDCLALAPSVLTIYVGINDVWRRYDSDDPTSAEDFERTYRDLLEQARGRLDARLILISPFVLPVEPGQEHWREDLDPKIAVVKRLADEFSAELVDADAAMTTAAASLGAAALAADGVHPTPEGHELLADEWLAVYDRA